MVQRCNKRMMSSRPQGTGGKLELTKIWLGLLGGLSRFAARMLPPLKETPGALRTLNSWNWVCNLCSQNQITHLAGSRKIDGRKPTSLVKNQSRPSLDQGVRVHGSTVSGASAKKARGEKSLTMLKPVCIECIVYIIAI